MRGDLPTSELAVAGEQIYRGVWSTGGASFALGKLSREACPSGEAIICVVDAESEISKCFSPAGVVVLASAVTPTLLDILAAMGIPYLILRQPISSRHIGRVALIDTERDILIVDPGIDTLNAYADKSSVYPRSERMLVSLTSGESVTEEKQGRGVAVALRGDGEELFENLRSVAEEYFTLPITISLQVPLCESDRELFCDRVEAIFRAAVYGSFAILLEGYRRREDILSALLLMNRVFCRLEGEGREINGYLRRGILIDSPIWLMCTPLPEKVDFFCFDLDMLTARMLGTELSRLCDCCIPNELTALWREYFSDMGKICTVRVGQLNESEFFKRWCELSRVREIYVCRK